MVAFVITSRHSYRILHANKEIKWYDQKMELSKYKSDPAFAKHRQIALDIDATIFPLIDAMEAIGNHGLSVKACQNWEDLPRLCGGLEPMLGLIEQSQAFSHASKFSLIDGALMSLERFRFFGIKIHLMTLRKESLLSDTEQWLRYHAVPVETLTCQESFSKIELCQEAQIPVLIDDHPKTLEQAGQAGLTAFTLDYGYNQRAVSLYPTVYSAKNWNSMTNMVLGAIEANIKRTLVEG